MFTSFPLSRSQARTRELKCHAEPDNRRQGRHQMAEKEHGNYNSMAKIPQFKTLEEAAEFWDTHDFEDYIDDTEPVTITVKIPRRKKTLTVPLDAKVYEPIEALAAKRGGRAEKMVSLWLKDKAMEELAAR